MYILIYIYTYVYIYKPTYIDALSLSHTHTGLNLIDSVFPVLAHTHTHTRRHTHAHTLLPFTQPFPPSRNVYVHIYLRIHTYIQGLIQSATNGFKWGSNRHHAIFPPSRNSHSIYIYIIYVHNRGWFPHYSRRLLMGSYPPLRNFVWGWRHGTTHDSF